MQRSTEMFGLKQVCFSFFNLMMFSGSTRISQYLNTRVIVENAKCGTVHSPPPMSKSYAGSKLECSSFCTSLEECRRFMFNSRTNSCIVFGYGEHCYVDSHEDAVDNICFRQMYTCGEKNCSRCPIGYYGDQCQFIIRDCMDGVDMGVVPDLELMAFIRPSPSCPVIEVKCEFDRKVTVIMQRSSTCNEVDFNRSWQEYVDGFGYAYGEFWIGLENLHQLLNNFAPNKLTIRTTTYQNIFISHYRFNVSDISRNYTISIDEFKSSIERPSSDMLTTSGSDINDRPFSTYDRDYTSYGCPGRFNGGWWYLNDPVCSLVNVNGRRISEVAEGNWFWGRQNQTNYDMKKIHFKITR